MDAARIAIFDTTLRDGGQAPGCSMKPDQKLLFARRLEELGVDVIEAGFPVVSRGEFVAVKAIAAECRQVTVAALCRALEGDIIEASTALRGAMRSRIHIFIATSDIHLKHKLKKTREDVLRMAGRAIHMARDLAHEVEFSAEDATRTDVDFLCEVFALAIESGASIINVPDTVGCALPHEYFELIRNIKEKVVRNTEVTISSHCHDDLGLAVANSLAAIEAGASQVECTINGIGERAGNAALEEVVMAMHVRSDRLPFWTRIQTQKIYFTSQLLSEILQIPIQPNKAIVGPNAFAHAAGIHQHGFLNNAKCYEIMTPESVGAPKSKVVLGKYTGRSALIHRYAELGFQLPLQELEFVYASFLDLAENKEQIHDDDLRSLLAKCVYKPKKLKMA